MKVAFLLYSIFIISSSFINAKVRIDISKEAETKNAAPLLPASQRLIIKNAEVRSEVQNCERSVLQLQEMVADKGGFFISSSSISSEQNRTMVTVVVRIPAAVFDDALDEISLLSSKVLSTSIYGNDATGDYLRISAQLGNRKNNEQRYHNMLKSAKKIDDIITIERYFGDIKKDIERLETELQLLNDKVSLLTIEVQFQQAAQNGTAIGEDDLKKVGTGVGRNLTGAANILDVSINFLISAVPFILFLCIPAFFLFKLVKKYRLVKRDNTIDDK